MTSVPPFSATRLTKIDTLTIAKYKYLLETDECYFLGEYTPRAGYQHSPINSLIFNFECPVRFRGHGRWHHKKSAINQIADMLSNNISNSLKSCCLVPVPPSKTKNNPEYDSRILDMLNAIKSPVDVVKDIRELVYQKIDAQSAKNSTTRPDPNFWENIYEIDEQVSTPEPGWICIIDDTLITGCRFRAMSNTLRKRFPNARITGIFVARAVYPEINLNGLLDFKF